MVFRANEEAARGSDRAARYLIPRDANPDARRATREYLAELVDRLGPVIESYPSWHPLVSRRADPRIPETLPGERCGYRGLDHTVYFANGFLTCPYGDGLEVLDSVAEIPSSGVAAIEAERVERNSVVLYSSEVTPILVRCDWRRVAPSADRTIPKSLAVPLMLSHELDDWEYYEVAESWESMRPYFLGNPHGSRSSLLISQETGTAMRRAWLSLIESGALGPIRR